MGPPERYFTLARSSVTHKYYKLERPAIDKHPRLLQAICNYSCKNFMILDLGYLSLANISTRAKYLWVRTGVQY
jgi:hypothetical protein